MTKQELDAALNAHTNKLVWRVGATFAAFAAAFTVLTAHLP